MADSGTINPNYDNTYAALIQAGSSIANNAMNQYMAEEMSHQSRKFARQMYDKQRADALADREHLEQYNREVLEDARAYEREQALWNLENIDNPAVRREQMLKAGLNPLAYNLDGTPSAAVAGTPAPLSSSMPSAPSVGSGTFNAIPADNSGIIKAAETAFGSKQINQDFKLRQDRQVHEFERWAHQNNVDDKSIEQMSAHIREYDENVRKLETETAFLKATFQDRQKQQQFLTDLYKSQDTQNKAYANLLNKESDLAEKELAIKEILRQHEDLELGFDKATLQNRFHLSDKECEIADHTAATLLAQVTGAQLQAFLDGRELDMQYMYDSFFREMKVVGAENEMQELRSYETDWVLKRANQLMDIVSKGANSFTQVKGAYTRQYNANTRRMEFGTRPWSSPNSYQISDYGSKFNPQSSWMNY